MTEADVSRRCHLCFGRPLLPGRRGAGSRACERRKTPVNVLARQLIGIQDQILECRRLATKKFDPEPA